MLTDLCVYGTRDYCDNDYMQQLYSDSNLLLQSSTIIIDTIAQH